MIWRFGLRTHIHFWTRHKFMVHAVWKEIIDEVGWNHPCACSLSEEPYNGRGCVVAYRGVRDCGCQMHASWCIVGANPLHTRFLLPVSYNWNQVQFWNSFLPRLALWFYSCLHCHVNMAAAFVLFCLVQNVKYVICYLNVIGKYLKTNINLNYI